MKYNRLKELIIVAVMILAAVLAIELQYIVGKLAEPQGLMYLGTVHYTSDYFYYLSQMIQGRENFLTSVMLYTSEKLAPVFVGWQSVLTGKILLSLGFSVIEAYQTAVIVYLTLFLVLGYVLLCQYFPRELNKRLLAFFFFITSTSLWKINFKPEGNELSYFWYWYNHGDSLVRFGPTPHHLLANSAFTALLILSFLWFVKKKIKLYIILLLIACSIVLSSISPGYRGLMVATLFFVPLRGLFTGRLKKINFAPLFFVLLSGIPVAIYIKNIFMTAPYSYSSIWESRQYVSVDLFWLITGSGLVIPLAFLGLKNYIKSGNSGRITGLILLVFSSIFYFSPLPSKLGLTNIRFWSGTLYLIWGALAAEGVFYLGDRARLLTPERTRLLRIAKHFGQGDGRQVKGIGFRKIVYLLIFLIYFISIVPTYYVNYKNILKPQLSNAFYYMPQDAYTAFKEAEKAGKKDSIYLVEWPFNESFSALTGRKSFFGFRLLTIDAESKTQKAFDFFGDKMSENQKYGFLKSYKIDYIVGYTWTPGINSLSFLKKIYGNSFLEVNKVEI